MLDGEAGDRPLVDGEWGVLIERGALAPGRGCALGPRPHRRALELDRHAEDDALGSLPLQSVEGLQERLGRRVVGDSGRRHGVPVRCSGLLDADAERRRRVPVGRDDDHSQHAGATGGEGGGGGVHAVAELLDRRHHTPGGVGAHVVLPRHDAGDGLRGDTGKLGDIDLAGGAVVSRATR